MNADRWAQLQSLFDELCDLPTDERTQRLSDLDDDTLRAQLEALLFADEQPPTLLRAALDDLAGLVDDPVVASGDHVGPYRIEEEIGRGGMGVVYRATRDDVPFTVALKLIRDPLASPEHIRRFMQERRVLARLSHPNIARLVDIGTTTQGTPFFAMEYVDGEPLDTYCDTRRRTVEQRIALVQTACQAVAYAHRALVVHRDLKPSNILVADEKGDPPASPGRSSSDRADERPRVRLLDFGIAKLLRPLTEDPDTEEPTSSRSPLTPAYASPEQVTSSEISAATDVYALGVVLYEVLSGARPYDVKAASASELEHVICSTEPARPSSMVTPEAAEARGTTVRALRQTLRGDLDTIILKALEKDPARRYSSAGELSADLNRYLEGFPITARPATPSYRAWTFVNRHRTAATLVAAALVLLIGVVATYTVQLRAERDRAQVSAERAEREASATERVTEFTINLFEQAAPSTAQGDTITVRQALDVGTRRVNTELADDPVLRGRMLRVIGRVYNEIGLYDRAVAILSDAATAHVAASPVDSLALASTQYDLGYALYYRTEPGDHLRADSLLQTVQTLRTRQLGRMHPETVDALALRAQLAFYLNRQDEAEEQFREVLARRQTYHADSAHVQIARAQADLGSFLQNSGRDVRAADSLLSLSLPTLRATLGPKHLAVARYLSELGRARTDLGRTGEAADLQREALAVYEEIVGPQHLDAMAVRNNLGLALRRGAECADAEAVYRRLLDLLSAAPGANSFGRAATHHNLGATLHCQGKSAEGEPHARQGVALMTELAGSGHVRVAQMGTGLGVILAEQGKYEEAGEVLENVAASLREQLEPPHPYLAQALTQLGALYEATGRPAQAEAVLREALAMHETLHADAWVTAYTRGLVGASLAASGRTAEGQTLLQESIAALREQAVPSVDVVPRLRRSLNRL